MSEASKSSPVRQVILFVLVPVLFVLGAQHLLFPDTDLAKMVRERVGQVFGSSPAGTGSTDLTATDGWEIVPLGGKPILFRRGQAELQETGERTLDELGSAILAIPKAHVTVVGLVSKVGDAALNRELAERRAEKVREALRARGLAPNQLDVQLLEADEDIQGLQVVKLVVRKPR